MSGKLVYSTASGSHKQAKDQAPDYVPSQGPCKMRLETKGRGGKAVTVLFNLIFASSDEAKAVMKELQTNLGCGATFKGGQIELRGDMRERVEAFFAKRQIKIVRAGG